MRNPPVSRAIKGEVIPYYDVAVLGDKSCGKSSIVERLISGSFTQTYTPTAAENYMTTLHDVNRRVACLQIFDTAGRFEFPVMLRLTITKCQAFMIVYSVNSENSLEVAKQKIEEIKNIKGKSVPCVLVGNKKDLESQRQITFETGLQTAVQYGCAFIETSALEDQGAEDAFLSLVKKIEFTAKAKRQMFREQRSLSSSSESKEEKLKRKSSVKRFIFNLSNSFSDRDSSDSEESDSDNENSN